jgi:hypothetical protein
MELAMRNLRAPGRKLCLVLLSTTLLAGGVAVLLTAVRANADSVGTLQMNGRFTAKFKGVECPATSPATTRCYQEANVVDELPGLGKVTVDYTLTQDDFGSICGHVHAQIPIVVAGKGEIDLATKSTGCVPQSNPALFPPAEVTVVGGSGRYAGASGSGTINYRNSESAPGSGTSVVTWTGTLNVNGLTFDTTPPQITGAKAKVAKTRSARGMRVRYSVSATDATDGPVTAACLPKSGSLFRIGRTKIGCTAIDGSGNTATAGFAITVKRVRS